MNTFEPLPKTPFNTLPWAGERQHDGVGPDWSMRVSTGEGTLWRKLSKTEIEQTAGWARPYCEAPALTASVHDLCMSQLPSDDESTPVIASKNFRDNDLKGQIIIGKLMGDELEVFLAMHAKWDNIMNQGIQQ